MDQTLAYYSTLLRKDFNNFCHKKLLKLDLSHGLLFYVLYIGKHPNCSPKQLTQALHMDTGHTTRSLAKLELSGFIEQETNLQDKRARILKLTAKGEESFNISHELFYSWDKKVMNSLSSDEQQQLITLLGKLDVNKARFDCVREDM